MENFINSLPKPLLAILVLSIGLAVIIYINPPHSICDAEVVVYEESLKGFITPGQAVDGKKKRKVPPRITQEKDQCREGNSSGACFDYFRDLKEMATRLSDRSSECLAPSFEVLDTQKIISDSVEIMVRIAWGDKTPEPALRYAWLQEYEFNLFCRMQNLYQRALGDEAWEELQHKVLLKLPAEKIISTTPGQSTTIKTGDLKTIKAVETIGESEVKNLSLFSLRCEQYY